MAKIALDKNQRIELVSKIQGYFKTELDQELAQFDGEFLLDFITETIGPNFYNQGLYTQTTSKCRIQREFKAL